MPNFIGLNFDLLKINVLDFLFVKFNSFKIKLVNNFNNLSPYFSKLLRFSLKFKIRLREVVLYNLEKILLI